MSDKGAAMSRFAGNLGTEQTSKVPISSPERIQRFADQKYLALQASKNGRDWALACLRQRKSLNPFQIKSSKHGAARGGAANKMFASEWLVMLRSDKFLCFISRWY